MRTILLQRVWMRHDIIYVRCHYHSENIEKATYYDYYYYYYCHLFAHVDDRVGVWYGNEAARDLHQNNIYVYYPPMPTHNNNNIMFMRFSPNSNRDQKGVLRVCFINVYRNLKSHIFTIWIISVHNNSPSTRPHAQLYNNYGNISENSAQLPTPRWLHLYSGCVSNRVCHYRLVRSFWIGTSKYCQIHPRKFVKIF